MPGSAAQSRILFVTPETAFMPERLGNGHNFTGIHTGGVADYLAGLIRDLLNLGGDVHVAQPDYRGMFAVLDRSEKANSGIKLPIDRVQLAEDRIFFYSGPIDSNFDWVNMKISLAFQREVINQIIPRVQPDLIHCHDWMTGLIPAAAKKFGIPCLFSIQKFDTASTCLSYIEDIGIDAAAFWQHLYYDEYPNNYEETREANRADFLLSGLFAANYVTTNSAAFLADGINGQSLFGKSAVWEVLAQKMSAGCASVKHHRATPSEFIKLYEDVLQHSVHKNRKGFKFFGDAHPLALRP